MSENPILSSARILALVAAAVFVAVVVLEARGDSAVQASAAQGPIVRANDPIAPLKSTPSVPKTSWPGPDTGGEPMGVPAGRGGGEESNAPAPAAQPCDLVSSDEAAAILEGEVEVNEGLQGPTCIYTSRDSSRQVALGIGYGSVSDLRGRRDKASRVEVGGVTGWCLHHGSSSVEVPLGDGRVLDVSGPCADATRFAALALGRVES
jgi:hypothetical protein